MDTPIGTIDPEAVRQSIISAYAEYSAHLDPDISDDDDEAFLDLRLRYFEGNWELKIGDPQYDTDHRGLWAYDSVDADSAQSAVETTKNLLWELENAHYMAQLESNS